jgi:glutamate racemase
MSARVLVYDSGLGGLSVARALRAHLPDAELVYAADNAAFPYGDWVEEKLVERIVMVMDALTQKIQPDIAVIACNTASTVALGHLRTRFALPFVGTVPAIKPAAEISKTGIIGVLATPGTVKREYTRALIDTYAYHQNVVLHGCPNLAAMAESALRGAPPPIGDLSAEIAPAFVERGGLKTDVLVLGCTHYPLIADAIVAASPWPVTPIDPSGAIARQAGHVLGECTIAHGAPSLDFDAVLTKADPVQGAVMEREGFAAPKLFFPC